MPFAVGSFVKSTTSGTNVVQASIPHGLGVEPKAMIFWATRETAAGFGDGALLSIGYVDENMAGYAAWFGGGDGVASGSRGSRRIGAYAIMVHNQGSGGISIESEGSVTAWDDTNFTITWEDNSTGAIIINFVAIGGADVHSKVIDALMPTSTGNHSVTGAGFTSSGALFASIAQAGTLPITQDGTGILQIGATDGTNQWRSAAGITNSGANAFGNRQQATDAIIGTGGSQEYSFVAFTSDGATLNVDDGPPSADTHVICLFLNGVDVAVGVFNKDTTTPTGENNITGLSFDPQGVMLASFMNVASATSLTHARLGIGASDGTNDRAAGITYQNGVSPSQAVSYLSTTKAFQKVDNDAKSLEAEANLTLETAGFDVVWSTNDAVATEMCWIALGGTGEGGGGGGIPPAVALYHQRHHNKAA